METLVKCCYCKRRFLFCAEDQEVFVLKDPALSVGNCEHCRVIQRQSKPARDNSMLVKCRNCSLELRVPYKFDGELPVFCSNCLAKGFRDSCD